jgi:hypothetical protein
MGALAFATPAAAQPAATTPAAPPAAAPGQWTVTPFAGVGFSGDLDSGTGAIGVAGGYIWSDRVQFEAEWNWLPSSENSGLVEVDSNVWQLTGNVLYRFNGRKNWSPYAAAGIGFGHAGVNLDVNGDGVDDPNLSNFDSSSTEFVADFGGGVERKVSNRAAFRGDLRYFFGGDLVPDFWRLSAGLSFGFGGR